MSIDDVKIKIYQAKTKSSTLAYVQVTFPLEIDGILVPLRVKNFRIMQSRFESKHNVLAPALRSASDKKYREIFFLDNKELWYKLKDKILEAYQKLLKEEVFIEPEATF